MPQSELFRHIPPNFRSSEVVEPYPSHIYNPKSIGSQIVDARNTEGIQTAMEIADSVRQVLTLLRVSIEAPTLNIDPQQLIDRADDTLHAYVLTANDRALAHKLNLPQSPKGIKQAISQMPSRIRL